MANLNRHTQLFVKQMLVLTGIMLLGTQASATVPLKTADNFPVVNAVDIDRYLGKWYEIARIDHSFQKGCINSTAEYSLRPDDDIKVVNSCTIPGRKDRKEAVGRAWVEDKNTNAKLRVQFVLTSFKLGFLSGQYWILALDDQYGHVMVGEPGRDYLWILSRTPELDAATRQSLLNQATSLGYDIDQLLFNHDIVK